MSRHSSCVHCGESEGHHPNCLVVAAQRGGSPVPFAVIEGGKVIMRGAEFIARARSATMARRIANALNQYTPNRRGE